MEIGQREQKVVNTMEKYKARIEKSLSKLQKTSPRAYEIARKYVNDNISLADEIWEIIAKDPDFKGINKLEDTFLTKRNLKYPRRWPSEELISIYNYTDNKEIIEAIKEVGGLAGYPNYVEDYDQASRKRLEARKTDIRMNARADKADAKEKEYQAKRAKFYAIKIGDTPALAIFLDNWKKDYTEYYLNSENKEKAKKVYQDTKKAYEEYNNSYKTGKKTWEEREELKRLENEYDDAIKSYTLFKRSAEKIYDDAVAIAAGLEADFINSVSKYCEDIADVDLHFEQGKLNGIVTGKDGKKWRVHTIWAGGFGTLQVLHLRTLVHEVK